MSFLGSYRKRVTTVRTIWRRVPVFPVQERLVALFVLGDKTRDLVIYWFSISAIGA